MDIGFPRLIFYMLIFFSFLSLCLFCFYKIYVLFSNSSVTIITLVLLLLTFFLLLFLLGGWNNETSLWLNEKSCLNIILWISHIFRFNFYLFNSLWFVLEVYHTLSDDLCFYFWVQHEKADWKLWGRGASKTWGFCRRLIKPAFPLWASTKC